MTTLTLSRALNEGLRRALEDDPKVLIMGEDVGKLGGVFRVTDSLQKDFGEGRVIDTPLAESGIVGTAIGLALRGYRPICEIQFDGFVYPAFDQIVSQLAKMRLRSLSPLDIGAIVGSVRRTGRCVVAHEAPVTAGLGAEIAARVTEECFYQLEAPVLRVGGFSTPYPPSKLEEHYLPDLDRILDAVDRTFGY